VSFLFLPWAGGYSLKPGIKGMGGEPHWTEKKVHVVDFICMPLSISSVIAVVKWNSIGFVFLFNEKDLHVLRKKKKLS